MDLFNPIKEKHTPWRHNCTIKIYWKLVSRAIACTDALKMGSFKTCFLVYMIVLGPPNEDLPDSQNISIYTSFTTWGSSLSSICQPWCLGWAPSSIPSWLKSLEAGSGSLAAPAVHWPCLWRFPVRKSRMDSGPDGLMAAHLRDVPTIFKIISISPFFLFFSKKQKRRFATTSAAADGYWEFSRWVSKLHLPKQLEIMAMLICCFRGAFLSMSEIINPGMLIIIWLISG